MRVEILSVGDEILSGVIVDTNSAFLARRLHELGVRVAAMATVGDALEALAEALQIAAGRADLLLVTGGLGPTEDDLTARAAAQAAGLPLEQHPEARAQVEAAVSRRGMRVSERQLKQARLPRGATVLENDHGTAPGFALKLGRCEALFFPGPPHEFEPLFERELPARLTAAPPRAALTLRTFGVSESRLAEAVGAVALPEGVGLGYRVAFPEIHLRLFANARDAEGEASKQAVHTRVEAAASALERTLGDLVFARGELDFPAFVQEALAKRGLRLALAESCTGGLLAKHISDHPGASRVLTFGAVTYANESKRSVLGVPASILTKEGAVSEACAGAMAEGARKLGQADLAVAITGIAGPGGGSEEKPVGTVCFAVDGPDEHHRTATRQIPGDRTQVRSVAAYTALDLVRQAIGAGVGRAL